MIRPLYDRVIVERVKAADKVGSLYIPDMAKEKPIEATVRAVGPGKVVDGKLQALSVKAGDKVVIGKYSGMEIELNGEKYLSIREDEILGVLE